MKKRFKMVTKVVKLIGTCFSSYPRPLQKILSNFQVKLLPAPNIRRLLVSKSINCCLVSLAGKVLYQSTDINTQDLKMIWGGAAFALTSANGRVFSYKDIKR